MLSVVVPAHRGAAVLHRSLGGLAAQAHRGALSVVVAVNDGRSDTLGAAEAGARLLRRRGGECQVIQTASGRAAAFNAAEVLLPAGPRLYLDQDSVLGPGTVDRLTQVLASGSGVHFAAPALRRRTQAEHRWATMYYDVWQALPYVSESPVTVGAYAVSKEGRRRWGGFPDLHSDDKFVRLRFAPGERTTISDCYYEVLLPDTPAELVAARRRYRAGNAQLEALSTTTGAPQDLERHRGVVAGWARRPRRWPSVAVFLAVHGLAGLPRRARRTT